MARGTENDASASWQAHGAIVKLRSMEEAPPLADRIEGRRVQRVEGFAHPRSGGRLCKEVLDVTRPCSAE